MKNNQFKKLAVVCACALPLASAAFADVDASLSLAGGFRWDTLERAGNTANVTDVTHISEKDRTQSATVELAGRVSFNHDLYVRAYGIYGGVVSDPKETLAIQGTTPSSTTSSLPFKNYCYDLGTALGWQFDFSNGEFMLSPELGYGYSRLSVVDGDSFSTGAPFVGVQFKWMFATNWFMDLGASYYFVGSRRDLYSAASGAGVASGKLTKGHVQGPEAFLGFGYDFTKHWSLGVKYRFKYQQTAKRVYPEGAVAPTARLTNEKTTWSTNHVSIEAGYTF